jgi:hypothetical protein
VMNVSSGSFVKLVMKVSIEYEVMQQLSADFQEKCHSLTVAQETWTKRSSYAKSRSSGG